MADRQHTETVPNSQDPKLQGSISRHEFKRVMRRLRSVIYDMNRVKINALRHESATGAAQENAKKLVSAEPEMQTPQEEQGEFRTFYVSPLHLRFEKEYLTAHNVREPAELLDIAGDILASYSGLIRSRGAGPEPVDAMLSSMGEVLNLALNAVCSARQIYGCMERWDGDSTKKSI